MKKLTFLLVVFFTATFSVHSQNSKSVETADEVGTYAFNIIKNLDKTSDKDFIASFISIEKLKELVSKQANADGSDIKEMITSFTKEAYEEKVIGALTELKKDAEQYNIVWSDIEFSEFSYEEENEDGFKGIRGDLIFTYKDQKYKVTTSAFFIDNKYAPLIVRRLRKMSN
ncbi:MAG: hypothetical protein AB8B65_01390 [Kordia sp.]|uniref:hypothetical protein n=1 Tax=Kordia sp. TaxID=1965332 RepID=UPI00385E4BE7